MVGDDVQEQLRELIRDVKDFPKAGIMFRDITTLLSNGEGLATAIEAMADPFRDSAVDVVVGAESRGFIFGTAIAKELGCGFVPVRKPGKLPSEHLTETYGLEYGTDQLEIHIDAVRPGQRVLMVDDLLATGGTMRACCDMVEQLGGTIIGISFLIELTFIPGREKLKDYPIYSVVKYDSE